MLLALSVITFCSLLVWFLALFFLKERDIYVNTDRGYEIDESYVTFVNGRIYG